MALKPEDSTLAGVAVAVGVIALYDHYMPTMADHKAADTNPAHPALDKSRTNCTWVAVGLVGLASLLLKDSTVFVIGGVTVLALDFSHRYADSVHGPSQTIPSVSANANSSLSASVSS